MYHIAYKVLNGYSKATYIDVIRVQKTRNSFSDIHCGIDCTLVFSYFPRKENKNKLQHNL